MRKKIFHIICLACFILGLGGLASCSDDDVDGGGMPEITGVRITNPAKADSLFTNSAPDSLIVIVGRNLGDARRVFINDQQVGFNPVFNTDHSLMVRIPSENSGFKLTAFDSELKDEIRVETSHGTAVYAFKIKAPYPSITRIQARYPRKAGDVLNVYGKNLVDIEKVYFTDLTAGKLDSTIWTEIGGTHVDATDLKILVQDHHKVPQTTRYETTSQLSVQIPSLPFEKGAFVIECAGGTVYFPFSLTLPAPTISTYRNDGGLSSDMPVIGERVTVYGTEFIQVEAIRYGDITIPADSISVAETEDEVSFNFWQVPSEGSSPTLTVVTGGGEVSVPFYDPATIINNFDNGMTDEGWGPNVIYGTSPFGGTGNTAHYLVENKFEQWWGTMCFFKKDWSGEPMTLPSYDVIPQTATTDELYFAIEVYDNNSTFNSPDQTNPDAVPYQGYFRYELWFGDNINEGGPVSTQYINFKWDNYDAGTFTNPDGPILQDINGKAHTGEWYRHVVKLSLFDAYKNLTYKDVYEKGLGIMRIMSLTEGTVPGTVDVYFDNIRLLYVPKTKQGN